MAEQLWFDILQPSAVPNSYAETKRSKGLKGSGCVRCPLDQEEGINKVLGLERIKGKRAMLWAQCPGKDENEEELELVGRAGQLLWKELKKVGLSRKDFDIQNVVRCRPTEFREGRLADRDPTKEELEHCSLHTRKALALNGGRAEVYLVFGRVAQQALLKSEFQRDKPVFWSETLGGMVFCLDHPSYFLRGYAPPWRWEEFRERLKAAAFFIKHPGRWSFLDSCDFKYLTKPAAVRAFLQRAKDSGERVSIDIEEGQVKGKQKVLCIGFSYEKRKARCVILDHPENPRSAEERDEVLQALKEFLEDASVPKVLQYGSYDGDAMKALLGITIRGYDFDTTYAHYLRYTFLKKHGLEAIAATHHPLFASYKDLIKPHLKGPKPNYADIPLAVISKYNCADAALTKEIEETLAPQVSLPLLKIYVNAGRTLHRMEKRGPRLDPVYFKEVLSLIPNRLRRLKSQLRTLADNPQLNPNTPAEIGAVLFDHLKLPDLSEGKRSTKENFLEMLAQETGHPFPTLVLEYRKLAKMESTYLRGYKASADMNGGELRTKWYLTGAVTGRLRSGGTKEGVKGVINMQNLHGSSFLQNLIVSDVNWRDILVKAILESLQTGKKLELPEELLDLDVFLTFDYSQIEIRMLAECSGDPGLIAAFQKGLDIHCAVGNELNPAWSFEFLKTDKETRTFVKNCHFGMVYGLDDVGLFYYLKAKGVKTTQKKVTKFHKAYFAKYAGVARFIEEQRALVREHGYSDTMFGFRRLIGQGADEDRSTNPENQAVNSPIQGSAHNLVLAALALLSARPKTYALLQAPLMEVHDALVFRVKLRDLGEAYRVAKKLLEKDVPAYMKQLYGIQLRVPLLCEGSAGFRYGVMVETDGQDLPGFLRAWVAKNAIVEEKVTKEYRKAA